MYYVEIDGESYPMKYGHSALKSFMHKYGLKKFIQLQELPGLITIDDMPNFVKAGFDTGAKVLDSPLPFTKDEVNELLEKNLWLETAAIEAFTDSFERPGRRAKDDDKQGEEAETDEAGN